MDTSVLHRKIAGLLKIWGASGLPNGKTLSETMTIRGIPLWDVMCPEMAIYILPKIFLNGCGTHTLFNRFRPYVGRAKQIISDHFMVDRGTGGCAPWSGESVFLFLGFNNYVRRDVLEPVPVAASASGSLQSVMLVDSREDRTYRPSFNFSKTQCLWQHWDGQANFHRQTIISDLKRVSAELKTMNALDHVLKDEERGLVEGMRTIVTWLLKQRLPQLASHVAVARHILEHHRPVLIISGDVADPRTRIYYVLGRQLGIPSLEIQYGLCLSDSVEHGFGMADRVMAFGDQSCRLMIENGAAPEKIYVTGSPRHDKLTDVNPVDIAGIRSKLGVPPGRAMVLFAASYFIPGCSDVKKLGLKITADLFRAADRSPNVTLVVKPHPILNQARETKKMMKNLRNIVFASPRENIQSLIMSCDAFIALGSTATLDALIANKLTITPAYPSWFGNEMFAGSDATLVPSSAKELAECLKISGEEVLRKKTVSDLEPARKRFLDDVVFKTDGKATKRILKVAGEMAWGSIGGPHHFNV